MALISKIVEAAGGIDGREQSRVFGKRHAGRNPNRAAHVHEARAPLHEDCDVQIGVNLVGPIIFFYRTSEP